MVVLANQLQHLPVTQAALRNGTLSNAQAVEVARGAIVAPNTETQLLNLAKHATVRDLRDATNRVVAAATDEASRHKRIHKNRSLKTWTDQDGAFNLKALMTVANGALVMAALKPFQDEIFKASRKSGAHERPEAYAADALMALCEKATTKQPSESGKKTTRPNVVMNIRVDLAAIKRGHTEHGEICEIAGVGPIPVVGRLQSSRRLAGSGEHHPISGIPDDEGPSIGLCKKIRDEKNESRGAAYLHTCRLNTST